MARAVTWIVLSLVGFVGALLLWTRILPDSGAIGMAWRDFMPDYTLPLIVFPVLMIAYVVLFIRRVAARVWLTCIIASGIPCVAALPSCIQYLHRAALQSGPNRIEGSDPDYQISVAISTFTLSLIFAAVLADIAVYGRIYRKT